VNADGNWALYNSADPSKELKFDVSGVSASTVRTLTVPDASGRIQVEGQAIGDTTPAAGTFTTLTANTTLAVAGGIITGASNALEMVSSTNAQTFRLYNTFTSSTNFERGFLRWSGNALQIGTEKGSGGGTARELEFSVDGTVRGSIATNGDVDFTRSVSLASGFPNGAVSMVGNRIRFQSSGSGGIRFDMGGTGVHNTHIRFRRVQSSGGANSEEFYVGWEEGICVIKPTATGTGTLQPLHISGLPTSNPGPGILWNDGGTVKVGA